MKKILMNVTPWQTRIVMTKDAKLQTIYFSAHAKEALERAFFKGKVAKVLPGIQTAFVEIGREKAGFLHISEIDRELAIERMSAGVDIDQSEVRDLRKTARSADIAKILHEGEEILVQVSKEPVYQKGAKLSTCFTLPGRFIVLMPNIGRLAISKRIEDRDERLRLKEIIQELLPEGVGAIIRTTSEGRSKAEIARDVNYLLGTWKTILKNYETAAVGQKVYEDLPLVLQMVRDHLDDDIEAVITDDKETQKQVYSFVKNIAPEYAQRVKLYSGPQNLFERYTIETQIEEALSKKIHLKSGGSIIIETTEAMTVIDVNTGRFTGKARLEDTILKTNLEAASEIVRQLRIRNIGGLIVIDFIDMAIGANRQKLFKHFEKRLKDEDRLQSVLLRVSEFGLVQMTRKRSGKTVQQELMSECTACHGYGTVKSIQTESYSVLSKIQQQLVAHTYGKEVVIYVPPELFEYIVHTEFKSILHFEKNAGIKIMLESDPQLVHEQFKIV